MTLMWFTFDFTFLQTSLNYKFIRKPAHLICSHSNDSKPYKNKITVVPSSLFVSSLQYCLSQKILISASEEMVSSHPDQKLGQCSQFGRQDDQRGSRWEASEEMVAKKSQRKIKRQRKIIRWKGTGKEKTSRKYTGNSDSNNCTYSFYKWYKEKSDK